MALVFNALTLSLQAQTEIQWQRTFGTQYDDQAALLFSDSLQNLYVVDMETHADFAGNIKPYMSVIKMDKNGNEVWRTFHDVAFNTFNPPYTPTILGHAFTNEWDEKLLNIIIQVGLERVLYKILDVSGDYYFYETIPTTFVNVENNNERIQAWQQCSVTQACYGPDSLVVERYDPSPDSILFDPIEWRFALKQNIRTAPIQGHYDFELQGLKLLADQSTIILAQIQRWDFRFCTDCNDAFVDAYNHIFKLDENGQIITHKNIKTTRAVVSYMRLISTTDDGMLIAINDINQAGTKVLTTLYWLDNNLNTIRQRTLDDAYPIIREDINGDIIAMKHIFDENDPNIKGFADVYWTRLNSDGEQLEARYWGGSDYDIPRGLVIQPDGSMVFMAETGSNDHDVETHFGNRDVWIVSISENTTGVKPVQPSHELSFYPNPTSSDINITLNEDATLRIFDANGKFMYSGTGKTGSNTLQLNQLPSGIYLVQAIEDSGIMVQTKVVKF